MTPQAFVERLTSSKSDQLFDHGLPVSDFQFDEHVTQVFPNMIGRSVPGYWQIVDGIGIISKHFVQPQSSVYDLGTSLGAVAWSIYQNTQHPVIAVDSSEPMIHQLTKNVLGFPTKIPINPILGDITKIPLQQNISFCALNFTLQFIPIEKRFELLEKIFHSLDKNGAVVLSEKLHFDEPEEEYRIRNWHHDWKEQQGYSRQEIEQKAKSIATIMPTETLQKHKDRLYGIGFQRITIWYQAFSFVSLVAEK